MDKPDVLTVKDLLEAKAEMERYANSPRSPIMSKQEKIKWINPKDSLPEEEDIVWVLIQHWKEHGALSCEIFCIYPFNFFLFAHNG